MPLYLFRVISSDLSFVLFTSIYNSKKTDNLRFPQQNCQCNGIVKVIRLPYNLVDIHTPTCFDIMYSLYEERRIPMHQSRTLIQYLLWQEWPSGNLRIGSPCQVEGVLQGLAMNRYDQKRLLHYNSRGIHSLLCVYNLLELCYRSFSRSFHLKPLIP